MGLTDNLKWEIPDVSEYDRIKNIKVEQDNFRKQMEIKKLSEEIISNLECGNFEVKDNKFIISTGSRITKDTLESVNLLFQEKGWKRLYYSDDSMVYISLILEK
jgi:hypothetical protein